MDDTLSFSGVSEHSASRSLRYKAREFLIRHIALIVLVVFLFTGVWVLDDYGVALDTGIQRDIAIRNLDYVLGRRDFIYPDGVKDNFYGVSFELPSVVHELRVHGVDPVIGSYFDVYMDNGRLIYVRDSCSVSDTDAKFFLHVVPSSVDDLPLSRVESGFDNLAFVFETHGLMFDGMCVASISLPDYDIERIRTGQWDPEQQRNLWKEEFDVGS